MEACQGAHHGAREIRKLGHEVRLSRPQCVTPYRKSQKHAPNDAAAICEAVRRPHTRFVPIQDVAHQEIQALHRARQLLMKQRTALCNPVRGLFSAYGIVVAQGVQRLRKRINRTNPDYAKYMRLETQEGAKRACWHSWIAPHTLEGFFLNMGDMLVKSDDWQTAQAI